MRRPQVNLLLTEEERDVLDAVALLEGVAAAEALRAPVRAFLNKQRSDPEVQAVLLAVQTRRAKREGKLSELRQQLHTAETRRRRR